ncbi:MAG TPA: sulfite exporter TauE/SafE family protein [Kofleriaceae bacterium]|nr:sulfite exporter TauE/SafE family protein [Kofleriaceae bacterium]
MDAAALSSSVSSLAAVAGAAFAAGAVNAIAGGGSLITFPTLIAVGLPPVAASITNTVALCPGYLGATLGQRRDLEGQAGRAALLLPIAALGGIAGGLLLLHTDDRAFDRAVPFLLLLAAVLVAVQEPLRARLFGRERARRGEGWAALPIAAAGVYGGYFGAGMGVMILAALGVVLPEPLPRINALKQLVSLVVNVTAALLFLIIADVDWLYTGVMAGAALAGGALGGRVASRVPARALRALVVVLGVAIAIVYFVK